MGRVRVDLKGAIRDEKIADFGDRGEYVLPGDMPIELAVRLDAMGDQEGQAARGALQALYGEVLALFQVHQPQLERLPIGVTELVSVLTQLYPAEPDGDGTDPTPPKAGTQSTPAAGKAPPSGS